MSVAGARPERARLSPTLSLRRPRVTAGPREPSGHARIRAVASDGAVLVSFWHLAGMPADSGTPTGWLSGLSDRIVHVHCICPPEVAAARFFERRRHPGHLDTESSYAQIVANLAAQTR